MPQPKFTCSVIVKPLPEQSNPEQSQYAFAYTVTIRNGGDIGAQLIARHWKIIDAHEEEHRVNGLAVVGKQPFLKPGETFEYTSWTHIVTPHGRMSGAFYCITEEAIPFESEIPEFHLVWPSVLH
jgi:ApaG protein